MTHKETRHSRYMRQTQIQSGQQKHRSCQDSVQRFHVAERLEYFRTIANDVIISLLQVESLRMKAVSHVFIGSPDEMVV